MIHSIAASIYFAILFIITILSVYQRRFLSKPDRWIAYWAFATLISETCSKYAIQKFHNNMPVYHIWSPIELFLLSMYFNESIQVFKKYRVGIMIGLLGCLVAIVNSVWLQPLNTLNSIFLLFEGFTIICCCLVSFYFLVINEHEITHNTHFWFTTILLIYWSSVFVYWGIYSLLITKLITYLDNVNYTFWTINILTYSGIGIVFINYRKMISYND